ncbi:MAG: lipid A biosynthesis (KDO)2-(lauroyl)-lipid IVA acyltransferase [Haliea sp.]|jgi:KDO2-lipid IV(A) lauroyltransferase|nr:lipid A biosynthesis (KDO)2-(lauroyl)-lipid IVA acyltransferase [Haliea sp.]
MFLYRCLGRLPFPLLYPLAWLTYLLLYYVAGYRKAVVKENLAGAFPDQSEREVTVLAKKFYRQFAQVGLEIARARYMDETDFRERVEILNPELIAECSGGMRQSVIILTIHQGNWEWMLHGLATTLGVPLDPVYKPLHSPAADRFMREVRSRFGSRPVAISEATRDILRRRREFRLLVMVADQSPVRRERSYWTRFMHRDAAFYLGAETIARTTGFPVLFAQCRRLRRGHYQMELHKLGEAPYDGEAHSLTESYVRMAERAIREEPESWLWSNRRWKRQRQEN